MDGYFCNSCQKTVRRVNTRVRPCADLANIPAANRGSAGSGLRANRSKPIHAKLLLAAVFRMATALCLVLVTSFWDALALWRSCLAPALRPPRSCSFAASLPWGARIANRFTVGLDRRCESQQRKSPGVTWRAAWVADRSARWLSSRPQGPHPAAPHRCGCAPECAGQGAPR